GLPNRYWRLITIIGLFGLVNFPDTLLLLRAKDLGYDFSGVVALLAFKLLCLESGYSSTGAPRPRK
ncbi:MAG: MFS transporter, partial [Acidimicrobiales bacterium]